MKRVEFILCHGSGNRFVLLDAVRDAAALEGEDLADLARKTGPVGGGVDGLLLLVAVGDGYGMRMFNPDGSEAEMCGNGIRCVARLAAERYLPGANSFGLWSGGRRYEVTREAPIYDAIPTYGVEIPVALQSDDFTGAARWKGFVEGSIPELDPELRFTFLSLGNPHLTAAVERIDLQRLAALGERVKQLPNLFPRGINVSLYRRNARNGIHVATYERGVGITLSCGTAMTASSTAACLAGLCAFGQEIEVRNRGGMVRCRCRRTAEGLSTRLVGNATFESEGCLSLDEDPAACEIVRVHTDEIDAYDASRRAVAESGEQKKLRDTKR